MPHRGNNCRGLTKSADIRQNKFLLRCAKLPPGAPWRNFLLLGPGAKKSPLSA